VCSADSDNKDIFNKTKNRRPYSLEEKRQHLDQLYSQNPYLFSSGTVASSQPDFSKAMAVSRQSVEEKTKTLKQRNNIMKSKENLAKYEGRPQLLVGKKIERKTANTWVHGVVLEALDEPKKKIKRFSVKFEDIEEKCLVNLIMDLKHGNLVIKN
jgi:hypothetical protein